MSACSNGPLDIVDQRGRVRRVHLSGDDDTVGALAVALALPHGALSIDGVIVPAATRLLDAQRLRTGSQVEPADVTPSGPAVVDDAVAEVAAVSGPDCGRWQQLTVGRHSLGRADQATVTIADPTVELYSGLLDIAPDGAVSFLQLSGRTPVELRSHETAADTQVITVGATTVHIRPLRAEGGRVAGAVGEIDDAVGSWRRVVRRSTAAAASQVPPIPDPPPLLDARRKVPATGLIAAGVSLVGAAAGVVIFGSFLFAVFAGLAAVASIATWSVSAVGAVREHRRRRCAVGVAEAEYLAAIERHVHGVSEQLSICQPPLADTLAVVDELRRGTARSAVWSAPRRGVAGTPGAAGRDGTGAIGSWSLLVGRGDVSVAVGPLDGVADHVVSRVVGSTAAIDVPIDAPLRAGEALAVHGPCEMASSLVRATLVDLATWRGPADVLIDVTTCGPDWAWARWLPHHVGARSASVSDEPTRIVVVDDPDLLAARSGELRRSLDACEVAVLVVVPAERAVPSRCASTVTIGALGAVSLTGARGDVRRAVMGGLSLDSATSAARALAALVDPEDVAVAAATPNVVDLDEIDDRLVGSATDRSTLADAIGSRWAERAPITAVLGLASSGVVDVCFDRDGPHALVGGTTGSGKSELLRTLVTSLATRHPPTDVAFVLVDYKGGAAFDACAAFPHVVGLVTDLDDGMIDRALAALAHDLRRREARLRRAGVSDAMTYRRLGAPDGPMPDLVVVVDEFATLAAARPHLLDAMVAIAQRGRSLGVHLILATQRPAGAISDDVRANTDIRIALRTQTPADSTDIIDDRRASALSRHAPGRALVRLGHDDLVEVQTARCTGPPRRPSSELRVQTLDAPGVAPTDGATAVDEARLIDDLVAATGRVMERDERARVAPLWIAPLPASFTAADIGAQLGSPTRSTLGDVGVIDDPAQCRRLRLRWEPANGGLTLLGSPGAGVSTTMATLLRAAAARSSPADLHIYVIDALGDAVLTALAYLPHCAAVVRRNERERLARTLARLRREVDRRGAGHTDRGAQIICAIDGYGALRRLLADEPQLTADMAAIAEDGPAVGVVLLVGDDGASLAVHSVPVADRWIFHLDAAVADRMRGQPVPAGLPGRLRVESCGLLAQVALAVDHSPPEGISATGVSRMGGPSPIEVLPPHVDLGPDAAQRECDGCDLELFIGIEAETLEPTALVLPPGDHALVVGGAGGGRTSTLRTIAHRWLHTTGGRVIDVAGRDPSGEVDAAAAASRHEPVLLVIDDAQRVDDPRGELAAIANGRGAGDVTIVAAARLDAVRAAFGHWTREVARSRCGVIMTAPGEIDGDLFGCTLPRNAIVAPRPGLGWIVDRRGQRLVQIAARLTP
ncbi:MAG: hypothetical protein HRT86_04825 [Ilumatobacteraceae bacterium]|nr:hypothetical protein [Ilumatobacteraceae bacterium]